MTLFRTLLEYLKPPKFDNDIQNFRAYIIYFLILTIICGSISTLVYVLLSPQSWQYYLSASYFQFAMAVIFYFLVKNKKINAVGTIYIASNFIITFLLSYYNNGINSPAYLNLFLIIIVASLIFQWKIAFLTTLLSIALTAILVYLDSSRLLPTPLWTNDSVTLVLYYSSIYISVFTLLASSVFLFKKLFDFAKRETLENCESKKRLDEKERRFKTLLENTPNALFLRDLKGDIIYANPSACKYSGYCLEELKSMKFSSLLDQNEVQSEKNFWDNTVLNGSGEIELKFCSKSGESFYLLISSKVNNDNEVFYYSQNTTKRKLAELKTCESLQAFQMIFEESPFVLTLNKYDGEYVDVNKRFCVFHNIKKEQIIGKKFTEYFHGKNLNTYSKMLEDFKENNILENYEFTHFTLSGETFNSIASIKLIEISGTNYILSAFQNITAIKKIQSELESNNQYINKIISSIPSIVWHIKFKGDTIINTFISGSAEEILKLPKGTLNHDFKKFSEYVHPDDKEILNASYIKRMQDPTQTLEYKSRAIDSHGNIIYFDTKTTSIIEPDGSLLVFGVSNDETLSREYEAKLIELNRELEYKVAERTEELNTTMDQLQVTNYELSVLNEDITREAQKLANINEQLIQSEENLKEALASKNKLFSIIAHDLRNPVSGIIQTTELLKNYFGRMSSEEAMNFINNLYLSSNSVYNLLVNLLEWARSQTNKIRYKAEVKNLYETVTEVLLVQKQLADAKNIEIAINIGNPTFAFYDKYMINVVIRNLISNAIKFTPIGGKVEITSKVNMEAYDIVIIIKDNGVGIPKEKINTIFEVEPNHSTAGTDGEKGTGLGLALCKEFIDKNGGKIWVESEVGKGSMFMFSLPLEKF